MQWPRSHFIIKSSHISPALKWSWNLLWRNDNTTYSFLGKNLYLGSIGITLTFQSKISIYFPRFKVVMGPTLFIYKTIKGITSMVLRDKKGLSSEWPKQPTLSLKVTTTNSFPNTKWSMRPTFACYSFIPRLSFSWQYPAFPTLWESISYGTPH